MSDFQPFDTNSDSINGKQAIGKITSPIANAILYNNIIKVEGVLSFVPKGYHVWLATKSGNLFWTKRPKLTPSPEAWTREVVKIGKSSEDFSLILLQIDTKGQCAIESWYKFGTSTGSYPGLTLSDLYNAMILDQVEGIIVR
jgi:hypothetical protein